VISVTGTRRSLRSIAESTVPVDIITSGDMQSTGQLLTKDARKRADCNATSL